ncbi:MAG: sulfatase-like hydrolase/transferase [Planctomycetota bacterium]|jgi:arylsulfatase A-like enzyme
MSESIGGQFNLPGVSRTFVRHVLAGLFCVSAIIAADALMAAPPGSNAAADAEGLTAEEQSSRQSAAGGLDSPLLRGLKQTMGDLEAFDRSGATNALTQQLQQADNVLSSIRQQNRQALSAVNRQQRVGRARRSPNLMLISIDRLGWNEPGCYGQQNIQTPRIDQLAKSGLRLTRFYAGSADAQAARWTLLNGLNTGHAPTNRSDRYRLHAADRTLAEWLWAAGYSTAYFGLWPDADVPTTHGYEAWSGFLSRSEIASGYPESIHVDGARARLLDNRNGAKQVSLSRLLASELHAWLEDARYQRRQFFVHVALNTEFGLGTADSASAAAAHRNAVERVDHAVGQLLDVLAAAGQTERTCVVLTAESGPVPDGTSLVDSLDLTGQLAHSPHGLSEGNLRVPFIVRWPGYVPAGSVSDLPTASWDIVPTLCELAHANRQPERTDGLSLLPLMIGKEQPAHSLLYWETVAGRKGQIAQAGAWKCVRLPGSRVISLFNLSEDPGETTNVAAAHPEVLEQLTR